MQIIVMSHRLAKARSITVSRAQAAVFLLGAVLALAGVAYQGLSWTHHARPTPHAAPVGKSAAGVAAQVEAANARAFMQQSINAMAIKLGEMQAQLMRLDALGQRVSRLAGIKAGEFHLLERPGLGGAQVTVMPEQNLSFAELTAKVAAVSRQVDTHADILSVLQQRLFERAVRKKLMPTLRPVDGPEGSGFGMRIDPFTGKMAIHEGIDFEVDTGTPVHAAAGGIVKVAGVTHDGYGKMVEIDHGNGLTTLYAHLSKLLVKDGDVVQRGQELALSGSTGRATGPHLHFEIRYDNVPLDPNRFLAAADPSMPTLASARRALARVRSK